MRTAVREGTGDSMPPDSLCGLWLSVSPRCIIFSVPQLTLLLPQKEAGTMDPERPRWVTTPTRSSISRRRGLVTVAKTKFIIAGYGPWGISPLHYIPTTHYLGASYSFVGVVRNRVWLYQADYLLVVVFCIPTIRGLGNASN
ncbi:hypothetical protein F5Y14DRAFT_412121 [Nemania sp. NC0429]|nr:hypothetical protein F5Y14DRAFT_412121 [Nemania sp. NC0429]